MLLTQQEKKGAYAWRSKENTTFYNLYTGNLLCNFQLLLGGVLSGFFLLKKIWINIFPFLIWCGPVATKSFFCKILMTVRMSSLEKNFFPFKWLSKSRARPHESGIIFLMSFCNEFCGGSHFYKEHTSRSKQPIEKKPFRFLSIQAEMQLFRRPSLILGNNS